MTEFVPLDTIIDRLKEVGPHVAHRRSDETEREEGEILHVFNITENEGYPAGKRARFTFAENADGQIEITEPMLDSLIIGLKMEYESPRE